MFLRVWCTDEEELSVGTYIHTTRERESSLSSNLSRFGLYAVSALRRAVQRQGARWTHM